MVTTGRAAYFSLAEQDIIMEAYEELKDIIKKKGNTATDIKQREKAWQSIADRLNASNMIGPKRTWQQVKIKYKNILQNVKKKSHRQGTGGGSLSPDLTPAEEKALELNKGRPVIEGIPGGTDINLCPSQDATLFVQATGDKITLLEPPTPASSPQPAGDADPGEGTSAGTGAAAADDDDDDIDIEIDDFGDEETISLDSKRPEDPDAVRGGSQPGNITSKAIRQLYATHLTRQIQLADVDIQLKRKQMRKLDLEIRKLERDLQEDDNSK